MTFPPYVSPLLSLSLACLPLSASTLAERSPFLPPGYGAAPETPVPVVEPTSPLVSRLELRGLYEFNGELQFYIADRTTNVGSWVRMNDSSGRFLVTDFNSLEGAALVTFEGMMGWIPLKRISEMPFTGSYNPQAMIPASVSPGTQGSAGVAATTASTVRRRTPIQVPPRRNLVRQNSPAEALPPPTPGVDARAQYNLEQYQRSQPNQDISSPEASRELGKQAPKFVPPSPPPTPPESPFR